MLRIVVIEEDEDIAAGDYPSGDVIVGSDEGCDLTINDPDLVYPHHARIWQEPGEGCFIRPYGKWALRFNGEMVRRRAEVKNGDQLKVGELVLKILIDPEGARVHIKSDSRRLSKTAVYMRLKDGVIDFSQAAEAQEVIDVAREILLGQGASPEEVQEITLARAREILEEVDQAAMSGSVDDVRDRPAPTKAQTPDEKGRFVDRHRPVLLILAFIAVLILVPMVIYKIYDLILTFMA